MGLSDFFSPGGSNSSQSSFSGLDPKAMEQWNTLFSGAQQGIAPWQQAGFNQAIKQAGTQFSALDAAKGGQNPFTGAQIASSAAQYVLPQFAEMNNNMLGNLLNQRKISTGTATGIDRGQGLGFGLTMQNLNGPAWLGAANGGGGGGGGKG